MQQECGREEYVETRVSKFPRDPGGSAHDVSDESFGYHEEDTFLSVDDVVDATAMEPGRILYHAHRRLFVSVPEEQFDRSGSDRQQFVLVVPLCHVIT